MKTIDLCLRVKPSGNKGSVLLHILALALKSLEQICYLSVLFLCSCLSPILMQWSCLQWLFFYLYSALAHVNDHLLLFYFSCSLPISVPHTTHILYSHKNSLSCSSAHHLLTAWSVSVAAPHLKKLQQHLQTTFYLNGYKPE